LLEGYKLALEGAKSRHQTDYSRMLYQSKHVRLQILRCV